MTFQRLLLGIFVAALVPATAAAAGDTIKIGFPMPLSGPASVYGVPVTKGAEMAVQEINASGGVLGRKLELLTRDSKANADEAVRLARELIIKDSVDFLVGTLTSAEAPAVSTIAKENKIVFIAPTSKTIQLTSPANLHPYIFRVASNTDIEGRTGAAIIAGWKDVKRVATIAPDYAYGRDAVAAFVDYMKKPRPDIEIVDQQWPKLGQSDFTPFINAQMAKKPDAVFCDVCGGDFVTFAKQAGPLGYFKAINNRLADGGEVGTTDEANALGNDYPYGIWSDAYDPVIWPENEPAAHKTFIEHLQAVHQCQIRLGLGDHGLHVHLRAGRWDQEGRQHQFRQGRQCAARADLRYADRQAHLQRKDPRDRNGRILGGDGQGRPLPVRRHQGPQIPLSGPYTI